MDIIGHHKERKMLRTSLGQGNIAQAYLFTGPRGIGKSLCALEFASLLAKEPDFEPSEDKPHPF
ncbi:MAG: DNA polymerase III subunit delta', partial [Candidatus Moranbacteria bacterium]|nr:DNA polymerase III subunit delta' [Candidatus Moranbacteria bacterium]